MLFRFTGAISIDDLQMAMVSNKFLAALSVKLQFHKHIRSNGAIIESQNREYVQDLEEVEKDANGARDYWTLTKTAPKVSSSASITRYGC